MKFIRRNIVALVAIACVLIDWACLSAVSYNTINLFTDHKIKITLVQFCIAGWVMLANLVLGIMVLAASVQSIEEMEKYAGK